MKELADSIRLERRGRFLYASPSDRMETYFENRSGYCKRYLENGSTRTSVNSYNYTSSENVRPNGKKASGDHKHNSKFEGKNSDSIHENKILQIVFTILIPFSKRPINMASFYI